MQIMKKLINEIHAECLKMGHIFLYPLHMMLPILCSTLFLCYYRFSGWSEEAQISGYMELIGIALPFVISIVCAGSVALEERNHFQILLGSPGYKVKGFVIKWMVLAGMGYLAIFCAVVLFGVGYGFLPGKEGLTASNYLQLIYVLFLGSLFLYPEHIFWNLQFPKNVSLCVGVIESLLSALFLTGLGEGRWIFFPCTWSARGVMLLLNGERTKFAIYCPFLLLVVCVIIGVWFYFYEGRQCND